MCNLLFQLGPSPELIRMVSGWLIAFTSFRTLNWIFMPKQSCNTKNSVCVWCVSECVCVCGVWVCVCVCVVCEWVNVCVWGMWVSVWCVCVCICVCPKVLNRVAIGLRRGNRFYANLGPFITQAFPTIYCFKHLVLYWHSHASCANFWDKGVMLIQWNVVSGKLCVLITLCAVYSCCF